MAKKSKIARNEQRKVIVARYNEKRIALKKTLIDENATPEEREAARVALQKLPCFTPLLIDFYDGTQSMLLVSVPPPM